MSDRITVSDLEAVCARINRTVNGTDQVEPWTRVNKCATLRREGIGGPRGNRTLGGTGSTSRHRTKLGPSVVEARPECWRNWQALHSGRALLRLSLSPLGSLLGWLPVPVDACADLLDLASISEAPVACDNVTGVNPSTTAEVTR